MSQNNVVLTIPEPGRVELVERPYPKIIPGYSLVEVSGRGWRYRPAS